MFSEEGTQQGGKTEFPDFFPAGYKIPSKRGRKTRKEREILGIFGDAGKETIREKATECLTCGDPTFQCDCSCKRYEDLLF